MSIKEIDELDYVEAITGLMMRIAEEPTARNIALDLWKYYPSETQKLSTALIQTQHTKKVPRLLTKDV